MSIIVKKLSTKCIFDSSDDNYPSRAYLWPLCGSDVFQSNSSHYYGFVHSGEISLHYNSVKFPVSSGYFFSVPGNFKMSGLGRTLIFERCGYRGHFYISGPMGSQGRLSYIDNCSVTQIFPPLRSGDPTLQALFFPPSVKQTTHIHPTFRYGLVLGGKGECVSPRRKVTLSKGNAFYIPAMEPHCFYSSSLGLKVIAYHPDSDGGPTDETHPMLKRTYVSI